MYLRSDIRSQIDTHRQQPPKRHNAIPLEGQRLALLKRLLPESEHAMLDNLSYREASNLVARLKQREMFPEHKAVA